MARRRKAAPDETEEELMERQRREQREAIDIKFSKDKEHRKGSRRQAWSGWGGAAYSMKRVAGWDFDHRLNGYITTAADKFSCDCGEEFHTPSGYRKCGNCGRAWNSYVIGTDTPGREASLEKVIVREIPVRKDVIVASKRHRAENEFGYMFNGDQNKNWKKKHQPEPSIYDGWDDPDDDPPMMSKSLGIDGPRPEGPSAKYYAKRRRVGSEESDQARFPHLYCINNCGNMKAAPTEDWSMTKGIPMDMNSKWQFYYERGDMHPEDYGDHIPAHWDSFNSWEGSGFCPDCHPYRNGHPNPQHPGYNEWLRDHKTHPAHSLPPQSKEVLWDPDKEQDPFDPRLLGASRRQAKGDCTCWEGYERVPGTKPCASGSCRKKKAARRYVAWCRQVNRMPNTKGFRRFLTAERMVRLATEMPQGGHDLNIADIDNQVNPYTGDSGSASQLDLALDGFGTVNWKGGRRQAARRYVAWCRATGRMPSTAGLRRFRIAERMVHTSQRRTAADEPFRDVEYSPGVWGGIHHHYPYPDRIPKIYDYDQFRKDNPDWFNPDGSPNPPPMRDSNPYSPSSRKIAPPMNMSPRSRYMAPNVHPEYGFINDVYRRMSEDEIKQHWPEVPRDQWTGYPGAVRFPGGQYHEPTYYAAMMAADPGLYKVYEPGWETGVAPQKPKPSAMPQKIKPRPGDPSSAESGLTVAKRRRADRHNLRRRDLKELEEQQPEEEDISIHHFSRRRKADNGRGREYGCDHCGDYTPDGEGHYPEGEEFDDGSGDRLCADCFGKMRDRHLIDQARRWNPDEKQDPFDPRLIGARRRRRAELFDITEEGETRKGKGKSDTPKMRKNPKDWSGRRQNGQYTNRWN